MAQSAHATTPVQRWDKATRGPLIQSCATPRNCTTLGMSTLHLTLAPVVGVGPTRKMQHAAVKAGTAAEAVLAIEERQAEKGGGAGQGGGGEGRRRGGGAEAESCSTGKSVPASSATETAARSARICIYRSELAVALGQSRHKMGPQSALVRVVGSCHSHTRPHAQVGTQGMPKQAQALCAEHLDLQIGTRCPARPPLYPCTSLGITHDATLSINDIEELPLPTSLQEHGPEIAEHFGRPHGHERAVFENADASKPR